MNILVTGGAGFLGQRLIRSLLETGVPHVDGSNTPVTRVLVADRAASDAFTDPRVEQRPGDIADPAYVQGLIDPDIDVVYHLAAVVSGEAEANFDLGMRVNVDASRSLLEACRATGRKIRVIFTSSVAVLGPDNGRDDPLVDPQSSYGMEKAVAELLLKDYARRGFVDGLVLRLPTISVRPGKPNKAASSFASGIVREPLSGLEAECPAPLDTSLWLLSPRCAIDNLVHAASLDAGKLAQGRVINLPGLSVTVAEMLESLERVGGAEARARVVMKPDEAVIRIVANWPGRWDDSAARSLGFVADRDFDEIIRNFIAEDLPNA